MPGWPWLEVLGREFAGVVVADHFPAHWKRMGDGGVLVQSRLAHCADLRIIPMSA